MWVVWNYIRCMSRIRSAIWTQKHFVLCNAWVKMRWHVVIRMWWHALMRVCLHAWIIIIRMILIDIFSMHTPWNIFLRKPSVSHVYSTMFICRNISGVIPRPTSDINRTIKKWSMMITWMMGGRRFGPRPSSSYTNAINTFSKIEQGGVVDIFRPTSMSCTFTPTIYSWGGRLAGLVPISNSPITINSISWKSQKSTTFTLVRVGIVAGRRPKSTSPFNMNYFRPIARGRVAGILWPRSLSINISSVIKRDRVAGNTWPTSTISVITWGRVASILIPLSTTFTTSTVTWGTVAGLKRPMSATLLTRRHFDKLFFRTFNVVVMLAGGRMDDIMRLRS